MCEPVTLTALAVGAASGATVGASALGVSALVGGVLGASVLASAAGAYQQSASAKAQAKYQGQVAKNNAIMADYAAKDANQRGGEEAVKAQQQAQRLRGAQVVRLAGNGLDINSGSPLAILEDTDYFGQQDAQTIRNNAARQAWGYQVEGQNFSASADMYSASAKAQNPALAAGTSLLSSASQFAAAGAFKGGAGAGAGAAKYQPGSKATSSFNMTTGWKP